ncbi:MAG TPA: substrate-binding domain-containing protein [Stellaceae bacterium]|nr:substrate-binding domain-containing protein [Stellaceae bacterium]
MATKAWARRAIGLLVGAGVSMMTAQATRAAEITVLTTLNIRPALDDLRPLFEHATGHTITFISQGAAATQAKVQAGVPADALIHARTTIEALLKQGLIKPGSIIDISHSSIGVVVRAGAPKPDIATDEKFRRALLAAPSLAYPDPSQGSLGGNYLAALFDSWGITDALKPKLKLAGGGAPAAEMAARGEVALALNQVAEFMSVKGIAFVTPLPPALTRQVIMSGALLPGAREAGPAAAWLQFLRSPEAAKALRAHGMEP